MTKTEEGKTKNQKRQTNNVTGVIAALLVCAVAHAAQAQPTFRTGTTLVEFTVVALDAKGNPVTDLTKDDLQLTDRGQPRQIEFFRFDGGGVPAENDVLHPLSPRFLTNRPEYQPEPHGNVTAIVFDLINTAPPDQNRARAQLLQYLKTLPANTPVGLFRFTENAQVTMLAPFTNSVELMRSQISVMDAALRREFVTPGTKGGAIVGGDCGAPGGEGQVPGASAATGRGGRGSGTMADGLAAFEESQAKALSSVNMVIRNERLDKTVANLEALGNHLAAIPGRKNVVWISSGMPIQLRGVHNNMNYDPLINVAARRLANQGIVIYPVDAKGNCRPLDRSGDEGPYGLNDATQYVFSSFNVFADVTGGRVVRYDDDLSKGVTAAANDLRGTYTIGFYTTNEPDDRWHSLQVATSRRGVTLRHRQGYLSAARAQPQSLTSEGWSQVARAPLGSSGIRLNGRPTLGPQQVTLLLQIAAGDLYFESTGGKVVADLEIGVVEKNAARTMNVRQQPLEVTLNDPSKDQRLALITSATTWPLNAGTTSLRVIVRDRLTGRYGTLEIPIDYK